MLFRPARDIEVTAVRHYWGTQVSFWTGSGTLLTSQTVSSVNGTWVETPLATPLTLSAGQDYVVGAYSGDGGSPVHILTTPPGGLFPDGVILAGCGGVETNAFPWATNEYTYMVGFVYNVYSNRPVVLTPTQLTGFVDGVWTGGLTLHEAASGVTVRVSDEWGHSAQVGGIRAWGSGNLVHYRYYGPGTVRLESTAIGTDTYFFAGDAYGPDVFVRAATGAVIASICVEPYEVPEAIGETEFGFCCNVMGIPPLARYQNVTIRFVPAVTTQGVPFNWLYGWGMGTLDPEADALADPDGDGEATWKEYVAGTCPTNGASLFKVQRVEASAGGFSLRWPSVPGRLYSVVCADALVGGWQPVVPSFVDVPGTGGELAFTNAAETGGCFFQVRVRAAAAP